MSDSRRKPDLSPSAAKPFLAVSRSREYSHTLWHRMIFEEMYWAEPGSLQPIREVYPSPKRLHLLDRLLSNADHLDSWKKDPTVRRDRRHGKVK